MQLFEFIECYKILNFNIHTTYTYYYYTTYNLPYSSLIDFYFKLGN